jgi:hypothetical protein
MTAGCEGPGKYEESNEIFISLPTDARNGKISICKLGFLFVKF